MSSRSQLFQLIKSLSRSEKGYFKKVYSQNVLGKKNQYLELFDAIDAQNEYDGDELAKQFEDKQIFTQLSVAKNYLHKIILKSLRAFHSQASVDIELNEMMVNIELLYNKRLTEACKKEIQRAEQLIIQYEVFYKYPEIVRWEKLLMNQRSFSVDLSDERKELYRKEKMYLEYTTNLADYSYLSYQLYSAYTKAGMARDPEMLRLSDEIISDPLLQDESLAKTIRAKSFYFNIRAKYHEIRNDFANTHLHNQKFVELLEENPGYIKNNLPGYVPGLYNYLLSCVRLRKHDDFFIVLEKLKGVAEKYGAPDELAMSINLMAHNVELFYLLNVGDFKGALKVAKEARQFLKGDTGKQSPQLYVELYYYIAYSYFGNARYDKALVYLNRIINNSAFFPREDMLCYARILNLVCHFEIGNERFVDYNLKSTYRFLSKMNKVYKFETIILSFIKTMLKVPGRNLLRDKLTDLRAKLEQIASDPYEKNAFEYFDFIGWLDSKLGHREFAEVVREKNQKLEEKN